LTVLDYIRLVCEDDLTVLVASGKPLDKDLEAARADVLTEFTELSGTGDSEMRKVYDNIENHRGNIFAATVALQTFDGAFDDELRERACHVLSRCGISTNTWGAEITEADIKRAVSGIKAMQQRLDREVDRYRKLASENVGNKASEADIRLEMVILSTDAGHTIADSCDMATYAAYKKAHKERVKALEIANLKRK
jgi:hypothetical protein